MTDADTLKWLADRAKISDLLHRFAYLLDRKQWADVRALYAEDGVLVLPWATVTRQMMEASGAPRLLAPLAATHHVSTNHQIEIDGDVARSNSYMMAMHVPAPKDQETQWLLAGWYDHEYRRKNDGWEITRAQITDVYESGKRLEGAKH